MNKYILLFILPLLLGSCNNEDDIIAERGEEIYSIIDDPSDPVKHYIYEFYKNTGTYILTEYDESNYNWDFNSKNKFEVQKLESDLTVEQLNYLKRVFLELYPEWFIKKYFPVDIYLAKSAKYFNEATWRKEDAAGLGGNRFMLIGLLNDDLPEMSEEQFMVNKGALNMVFWESQIINKFKLEIPREFYAVSNDYYVKTIKSLQEGEDEKVDKDFGFVYTDNSYFYPQTPDRRTDVSKFFEFMFANSKIAINEVCAEYPLVKEKYNILLRAIRDQLNLNIEDLQDN